MRSAATCARGTTLVLLVLVPACTSVVVVRPALLVVKGPLLSHVGAHVLLAHVLCAHVLLAHVFFGARGLVASVD